MTAPHDTSTKERRDTVLARLRDGEQIVRGRQKGLACWQWQPSGERAPGTTIQAMIHSGALVRHGNRLVEG